MKPNLAWLTYCTPLWACYRYKMEKVIKRMHCIWYLVTFFFSFLVFVLCKIIFLLFFFFSWRLITSQHFNRRKRETKSVMNPMDRGTWWATVHRVAESQTQLKQISTYMGPLSWQTCLHQIETVLLGFHGGSDDPWVRKVPWRREWLPTPAFLPGEFHDGGAWQATVHGVMKSWTQLSAYHLNAIKPLSQLIKSWVSFAF